MLLMSGFKEPRSRLTVRGDEEAAQRYSGSVVIRGNYWLGPNCHAALEHWSGDRFRTQFVLRFPEDWFFSFVRDKDRVVKVTIANVFPSSDVGTFSRVD